MQLPLLPWISNTVENTKKNSTDRRSRTSDILLQLRKQLSLMVLIESGAGSNLILVFLCIFHAGNFDLFVIPPRGGSLGRKTGAYSFSGTYGQRLSQEDHGGPGSKKFADGCFIVQRVKATIRFSTAGKSRQLTAVCHMGSEIKSGRGLTTKSTVNITWRRCCLRVADPGIHIMWCI